MVERYDCRKLLHILVCVGIICCMILLSTNIAMAASKNFTKTGKHIIPVLENGWVTVNTSTHADLTYKDSGTTRKFTHHCTSVHFTSINDTQITRKLVCSMGNLVHYNPSKVVVYQGSSDHARIVGTPYVADKHSDSSKIVSYTKGGTGYCKLAYAITGGVQPISEEYTFNGLTK